MKFTPLFLLMLLVPSLAVQAEGNCREGSVSVIIDRKEILSGDAEELVKGFQAVPIPGSSRTGEGVELTALLGLDVGKIGMVKMTRCSGKVNVIDGEQLEKGQIVYYLVPNRRGFFKLVEDKGKGQPRTTVKHITEVWAITR